MWAIVGLTGEAEADDRRRCARGPPRRRGSDGAVDVGDPVEATTTKVVVTAPDAPGEVREAMRVDRSRARRRPSAATALRDRVAQSEPYARLLDEELTAAGIPMHGPSVRTLAQSVAGRTLLGALALADDEFGRPSVVRLDERRTDPHQQRARSRRRNGLAPRCGLVWCAAPSSGPSASGERRYDGRPGATAR